MENINTTHNKIKINSSSWDQTPIEQLHNILHFHHQIPTHINSLHLQLPQQIPSSSAPLPPSNSLLVGEEMEELEVQEPEQELGAMKEMIYKIAAMQPVDIDPATIPKPKRRNVRISDDPQSVAARHRRERISERIRILQRLVPGGTKMDTASMLDEAIQYVKFLKRQIRLLQSNSNQLSAHCTHGVLNSDSSPRLASADVYWGLAVPNKLGHGRGPNLDSAGVALAVGGSSFHEALGFNHGVISDHMIN